jgi:hypothetical protein
MELLRRRLRYFCQTMEISTETVLIAILLVLLLGGYRSHRRRSLYLAFGCFFFS